MGARLYHGRVSSENLLDRLIRAAVGRGGERLDLVSGKPAVLVQDGRRLQAGKAVVGEQELESWLEACLPAPDWVAVQLGKELEAVAEVAGAPRRVLAQRRGDTLQASVVLAEVAPPVERGPKPTEARPGRAAPQRPAAAAAPPTTGAAAPARRGEPGDRPLDRLLTALVEAGGSDLHLSAGSVPMMRLHGVMAPLPGVGMPLGSEHILLMCEEIAPAANRQEFRDVSDTDLAYEIEGLARFRVNLFRDRHGAGAVFRQIPSKILSFEDLGLPECVRTLCTLSKGLVLVTGPTGSGKSTTLAAMIDFVNETRSDHIITIEDPIEFVHENKRCLVNQREVHNHTMSFKAALRAALRQDPDIVLVGELRDLETMAIAIETAETGHLVFGTLHTTTAVSTVDRMVDQFPPDRQEQVRVMLSESLKGVVAQILCRRAAGGRVAAYEILLGVPAVANLIREAKTFQIPSIMQTGKRLGMRTLNDSLATLVKDGVVDVEEAVSKAVDKDALRTMLKNSGGTL